MPSSARSGEHEHARRDSSSAAPGPAVVENPCVVERKSTGAMSAPVTGSTVGCLLLNCVSSKVCPVVDAGSGNHVGNFARDVQEPAAVVADVQNQVLHAGALQLGKCRHQFAFGSRQMVVEQHIAHAGAVWRADGVDVLHRRGSHVGRHHGDRARGRWRPNRGLIKVCDSPTVCGVNPALRMSTLGLIAGIDDIDAVDAQQLRAARKTCRRRRRGRSRLGVGNDHIARRRRRNDDEIRAVASLYAGLRQLFPNRWSRT